MSDASTTEDPLKESHLRSLLKGLSWRIIATSTTILAAWWITGDTTSAMKVGGVEFVAKLGIYYGHERIWQMVPRGTIRKAIPHKSQD